jgi:hypothetical protein
MLQEKFATFGTPPCSPRVTKLLLFFELSLTTRVAPSIAIPRLPLPSPLHFIHCLFDFLLLRAVQNVCICPGFLADQPRSFESRKLSESSPASSRSQWISQIYRCMQELCNCFREIKAPCQYRYIVHPKQFNGSIYLPIPRNHRSR